MSDDKIEFDLTDEQYADLVREQRRWLRDLAAQIERGEPIQRAWDRKAVAALLRHHADEMREAQPRKRGQAHGRKIDYGSAALQVAAFVHWHGMKKTPAMERAADLFGVSIETIKKAWREQGAGAERVVKGN